VTQSFFANTPTKGVKRPSELAARHTDLIYSAALRQLSSPELARDITQSVFADLARKAPALIKTLLPEQSLVGWLYRSTRYAVLTSLRTERRRRSHERQLMESLNPTSEPAPDWDILGPVLDEAMSNLGEQDRDALLLRFFKNQDYRAVGVSLGISDDAAQKRVTRALEKLRSNLSRQGITTTAAALSLAISSHAVQSAPLGLSSLISSSAAVLASDAAYTATIATKAIAMTTMQKVLIASALVVTLGTGIYQAQRAFRFQKQIHSLQQQHTPLADRIAELQTKFDRAASELALAQQDNEGLRASLPELLRLRGEVARLRNDSQELAQLKSVSLTDTNATQTEMKSWLARVNQLKQGFEAMPHHRTPELQLLTEQDWLDAARHTLETERDYRRAFSSLREAGVSKVMDVLRSALKQYMDANNRQFPTDLSQLKPYFKHPLDDAVLERYAVFPAGEIPNLRLGGEWIISPKAPLDPAYDGRSALGPDGSSGNAGSYAWTQKAKKTLAPATQSYKAANGGREPSNPAELLPHVSTPAEHDALQLLQAASAK
jgi:RNA polymerase sigma factor (sigma-70 family)